MRFTRQHLLPRLLVIAGAFGLVAAALGACGSSDALSDGAYGSTGAYSTGNSTVASGGGGQDASLDITADQTEDAYDPTAPYAHLCGRGPCTPGAEGSECQVQPGAGGAGGAETLSCKLAAEAGQATATCAATGTKEMEGPCQTSADCAEGLGCAAGNTCRPYCCGDVELCPEKTYCAPTHLAEDTSTPPAVVPLCIVVTACALLTDMACATPGQICSIVRNDGTTSCVTPGTGQLCEPCECADGFVCSKATNQCRKLCKTSDQDACPGGYCQAGSMNYPMGIGVCVGGDQDC